jgi:RNA polymerase sigma factor (sigma-70 family)
VGPIGLRLLGDERLARLVERDREGAFATLYERYHAPLFRYCVSILGDREDAHDALQSTLTNAFVALRGGKRDAPVRPWLFRIARDEAISLLRRRTRVAPPSFASAGRLAPSAEDEAAERARLAVLVADLRALPPRQRDVLLMREVSGLSHEEIAIALGISMSTVRGALFRARCALVEFQEGRSATCETVRHAISDDERGAVRHRHVSAHLRDCNSCAAFAASIRLRRRDWHALASPLPPIAMADLLARIAGAGAGHGATGAGSAVVGAGAGHGATGAGGAVVGAGTQTLTASLVAKATLGVVIAASATATLNGVSSSRAQSPATAAIAAARSGGAAGTLTWPPRSLAPPLPGGGAPPYPDDERTGPRERNLAPARAGHGRSRLRHGLVRRRLLRRELHRRGRAEVDSCGRPDRDRRRSGRSRPGARVEPCRGRRTRGRG